MQGIYYSSENATLYRKLEGGNVLVVGETEIVSNRPKLKILESKLLVQQTSSPTTSSRARCRRLCCLPSCVWSWCCKHLFCFRLTSGDAAARISELEEHNDRLVWIIASQKQKLIGLRDLRAHGSTAPPRAGTEEQNLATRLINYAQSSTIRAVESSAVDSDNAGKLKAS